MGAIELTGWTASDICIVLLIRQFLMLRAVPLACELRTPWIAAGLKWFIWHREFLFGLEVIKSKRAQNNVPSSPVNPK